METSDLWSAYFMYQHPPTGERYCSTMVGTVGVMIQSYQKLALILEISVPENNVFETPN